MRWTQKNAYAKQSKIDIPMITESIVWMHGVWTNMVRPVYIFFKSFEWIINPYDKYIEISVIDNQKCTIDGMSTTMMCRTLRKNEH